MLLTLCGSFLQAQTTGTQSTNIAIETSTLQPSIKRLGINLGTVTDYDSGQISQNLINSNPGFEGQIWNSTIRCAYGTATTCTDENQYADWPAGFWNGATYQIFYGTAAGRSGTVTTSSAPGYGEGVVLTFGDSGIAPAEGDYLILHKNVPGSSSSGWAPYTYANGSITDNFTDLPPGTLGKQTTVLTSPTQNDFANLSFFFDSTAGKSFVQLNGTYQLQFKAKAIGGSGQMYVQVTRYGVASYISQVMNLTNTWQTYNLTFTANENGSAIGTVGVAFSTVGATAFELDDASLTPVNTDPTNTTHFRDAVVDALRTLQPGTLRYWGNNGHLGETLDNLLTPQFGRQLAGYSPYFSATQQDYGLHDFLELAQLVGAEPWFVVPTTFSQTDASNLIQYLSGSTSTTYGAKRAALGQATPWTQVFSKIHLEFGNEAWNGTFKGGSIEYPQPYGEQAQTIFAAMQSNPAYVPGSIDFIIGGQAYDPGRNISELGYCNNFTSFAIAPYTMNEVDSFATNELLFGSTFAEPEALMSPNGTAEGLTPGAVYQAYQALQSSTTPVPLAFYEINLSTLTGAITQQALNAYTPSLGAGLMVADTMLQAMANFGVVNQELFALPQYDFNANDGNAILLWGSVIDMGVTNRRRPQYLALELANQALSNGATMVQTLQSGANPTWNEPLTNSVQYATAHYIQSYAFANGQNLSAVLFNLSRTTALPVTFSGNAPGGTVQMQQLTSANLTDTNENSNVISITPSTLSSFNPAAGLTLPPYSMTVLTWTQQGVPPPAISAVASSGITTTSATITWTTDQASTSLVNYGTTTGYGSSSALNNTLTTSHSVTLTGLTPGVIYDFDVVSANSAGSSSTSGNSTFTTITQPPVISAVGSSGVSATSATITWTTDQPSTSLVNYGTTAVYGSASALNSTLSTSHSVTLTGLTPGITYDFDVVSANSAGSASTSGNLSFTTTAQAPVISAVGTSGIKGTSATITWTTDQATTSLVNYGTTTGYGSASALNSTLSTSHSVTLTGLTPGITYDFDVVSANLAGTSSTSGNHSFTTTAQAPVISAVTSSAITGTSATITWTTDQASSSLVNYGTTTGYGSSSTLNATLSTSHSVTLTGLTPGLTYDFDVVSANSAGSSSTSANGAFATTAATPLKLIGVASWSVTTTGATIGWSTEVLSNTQVFYGTSTSLGLSTPVQSSLTNSHGVTLTGLNAGTTYYYIVQSTAPNGSTGTSSVYSFTTYGVAEPQISAVAVSGITGTSATITWTTDQPSTALVSYGTTTGYGSYSALNSAFSTSQSVTLTGLTPGTTYDFAVLSTDSAGYTSSSANQTFTTTTTTAPAPVISAVSVSGIGGTSATITWTTDQATTSLVNYGTTTGYGSYSALNSTLSTSHSVTLTGLTPGITYDFDVVSANSAGTSSTSANQTLVTTAQPPVISAVSTSGITTTSATITWTTDQATTSLVNYGTTTGYGAYSAFNSTLSTSHSVTLTGLTPGITYDFDVVSANAAGTSSTSANGTFATPTTSGAPLNLVDVSYWSVTSTGVTIGWSTEVLSNTQVAYGLTSALGLTTPLQSTLTNSHGVTITGLTPGTTYYFVAQSTAANGSTGTSSVYSFQTIPIYGPVISNVVPVPLTGNVAQVTWTTSVPTYSYVAYGSTTSYTRWSPLTGLTSNPAPYLGFVPSGLTHYQIYSTDQYGNQTISPDYTFVEP